MVVTVLKLCALLEERYGRGGRFSQVERSFVLFGAAKFRYEPSSFGARVSQSMYCTALHPSKLLKHRGVAAYPHVRCLPLYLSHAGHITI